MDDSTQSDARAVDAKLGDGAPFRHMHAGHCESGVTAALFSHKGLEISEPMIFGIGSGIGFFFPPLVRVMGFPLISFRSYPGEIFKLACKRLGCQMEQRSFSTVPRGMAGLDELLGQGVPVGLRTNMFWLSYFPREFRSQFNGHNLIALRKDGETYTLSDPVLAEPVTIDEVALNRSRFAKGALAPKGALYYVREVNARPDIERAVVEAIEHTAKRMTTRTPVAGVRGIRRLARHVRAWETKVADEARRKLLLGHIVRMQEEVGTGGAGFRFMYAAFLQEAAELMDHEPFRHASREMTRIGDLWRAGFAATAVRVIKGRSQSGESFDAAATALETCAAEEEDVFRYLRANLPGAGRSPSAPA